MNKDKLKEQVELNIEEMTYTETISHDDLKDMFAINLAGSFDYAAKLSERFCVNLYREVGEIFAFGQTCGNIEHKFFKEMSLEEYIAWGMNRLNKQKDDAEELNEGS